MTNVEDCRRSWEQETEKSLTAFQLLEEERLFVVRDSLWRLANMASAGCVSDDQGAEELRTELERCDLEKAMRTFADRNATGASRPRPVRYSPKPTSASAGLGHDQGRAVSLNSLTDLCSRSPAGGQNNTLRSESRISLATSPDNSMYSSSSWLQHHAKAVPSRPKKPPRLMIHSPSTTSYRMSPSPPSEKPITSIGGKKIQNMSKKVSHGRRL